MTTPDDEDGRDPTDHAFDETDRGRFRSGELALFLDRKGRTYQETLNPGGEFHCHLGWLPTTDVIGQSVGRLVHHRSRGT